MTPDLHRFGASSLLNDVLMQIRKERTGRYQAPTTSPSTEHCEHIGTHPAHTHRPRLRMPFTPPIEGWGGGRWGTPSGRSRPASGRRVPRSHLVSELEAERAPVLRLDVRARARVAGHRRARGPLRPLRRRPVARAERDVHDDQPGDRGAARRGRAGDGGRGRPAVQAARGAYENGWAKLARPSARSTSSGSRASFRSARASSRCSSR